jgi:hypothetical protein
MNEPENPYDLKPLAEALASADGSPDTPSIDLSQIVVIDQATLLADSDPQAELTALAVASLSFLVGEVDFHIEAAA